MINSISTGQTLHLEEFVTSKHGITYKIITPSSQKKPQIGDRVTVHYTGYLLKGTCEVGQKFDSSLDRQDPFEFHIGYQQVIEGWEISLSDMSIGEQRIIILPPKLAYGNQSVSIIPAHATLIFEVALLNAA